MNKRTLELAHSLVGCSIDFSFKKKADSALTIEKNIVAAKRKIERDVNIALSIGGQECVMLLAELTSYYSKQLYYMAVRSCIEMRRYRPAVLKYLALSVDERASYLARELSKPIKYDKGRDAKITALSYFVKTYESRLTDFKPVLTREEFLTIA